MTAVSHS